VAGQNPLLRIPGVLGGQELFRPVGEVAGFDSVSDFGHKALIEA